MLQQPLPHNLFGTDGIRTRVGQAPFTSTDLVRLGHALGLWACKRYGKPHIVLGHDTRISCSWVKAALQTGLLLHPVTLYDAHVLPTPALCKIIKENSTFDMSIIISASHNPYHDNGIKIVDRTGKISHADELALSSLFFQESVPLTSSTFGTSVAFTDAHNLYLQALEQSFPTNFLYGKKIVIDGANGATTTCALQAFKLFGADVIPINYHPNGTNINHQCGALHLADLQKAVIEQKADIGFAFDGDGDRVMTVNRHGQIKNGDDALALLLDHPAYAHTPAIVGTIMSNQGFEVFLTNRNKKLIRTAVGDKYVAEQLGKENLLLGGEQSGHTIMRDYLDTGDGIFTALRIAEACMHTNNWDLITFTPYPQVLLNIPVTHKKDLTLPHVAYHIERAQAQLHSGRVVVRYSGTENLLRIMIEDSRLEHAHTIGSALAQALHNELSTL